MGTTTSLLTFEEFERRPERPGKEELLEGELFEMPPPESKHNRTGYTICKMLDAALAAAHGRGEARDLGEVFPEMGYRLGPRTWMQPDVSITHAGQIEQKYFEGAPAIAIEVVSPSDSGDWIRSKTELYFQFGAREVWWVYQSTRQIEAHVPGGSRVFGDADKLVTPLLPGFELEVGTIFPQQPR